MIWVEEALEYFKNGTGFTRLMDGINDIYIRYDRCFGAVRLSRPSPEEENAISVFFKRDYYNQALIRIGLADFERQAQKLFSPEFKLAELLEAYFGKRYSRKPGPRVTNIFSIHIEDKILPKYAGKAAEPWLREICTHVKRVYRFWSEMFAHEPQKVERTLTVICDALPYLPVAPERADSPGGRGKAVRLSEFSRERTGDAETFCLPGAEAKLFLRALAKLYGRQCPTSPEDASALYYRAGLLSGGALNTVTARGLIARRGNAADEASAAYDKTNEAYVLTLENIDGFTSVEAYGGKVFIMENVSVFSAVSERARDIKCSLLCASGEFNPAFGRLLDLLSASGAKLYYSGDMDFNGLCLADRIYLAYPKHFVPWRYCKADYERFNAEYDPFLPEHKKDLGLHNEDLAALLSAIRKQGRVVSQSALIPDLVNDIRNL